MLLAIFDTIASQMVVSGFELERDTFSNDPETPQSLQGMQNILQNFKEDPILIHAFLFTSIITIPLLFFALLQQKFFKKRKRRHRY